MQLIHRTTSPTRQIYKISIYKKQQPLSAIYFQLTSHHTLHTHTIKMSAIVLNRVAAPATKVVAMRTATFSTSARALKPAAESLSSSAAAPAASSSWWSNLSPKTRTYIKAGLAVSFVTDAIVLYEYPGIIGLGKKSEN